MGMQNPNDRLSRRMVLKVAGWLTVAGGLLHITGISSAQKNEKVISETVRFAGKSDGLLGDG